MTLKSIAAPWFPAALLGAALSVQLVSAGAQTQDDHNQNFGQHRDAHFHGRFHRRRLETDSPKR